LHRPGDAHEKPASAARVSVVLPACRRYQMPLVTCPGVVRKSQQHGASRILDGIAAVKLKLVKGLQCRSPLGTLQQIDN
jgi:hypothetical protein